MNHLDKQNLKSILKPFKDKIDNLNEFKDEATIQLNNKLSLTGGTLTGSLSIKNGDTTNIVLSAQKNSARLSIGTNHLDLTNDGKLKVNDKEVGSNKALEADLSSKLSLTGGTLTGSLSIKNGDTTSTLSTRSDSARLSIGSHHLDFTKNGELKINDVNINASSADIKLGNIAVTPADTYSKNKDIPYSISEGSAVSIGTDIYLLGGYNSNTNNYKYDTITNTYTKNKDIPYNFYDGSAVAIGNNIYLLGSSNYSKYNYKYDTITNTYTKNKDIPYIFRDGSAVAIGTDIYILGGTYDYTYNYKYDTTTNTYTKNKNIPYQFYDSSAVAIGTDIYLLGTGYYNSKSDCIENYKYDTTTDIYTKNKDIPYIFRDGSAVAIGTDIYILGSGHENSSDSSYPYAKYNYKYDTTTNTYTKKKDIPYNFYDGSAVAIGNNIYLLGSGNSSRNYNYKYTTTTNCTIKKTNHSIYTQYKSYTSTSASIVEIGDEYYTEYNGNNIIKNTFSINSNGTTKMYIKSGAILNGKKVPCKTEGWQTINILDYM